MIAIRLNDGVPDSVNAHLFQHLEQVRDSVCFLLLTETCNASPKKIRTCDIFTQVGHLVLDHASRVLAGSASKDLSMDDSKWYKFV